MAQASFNVDASTRWNESNSSYKIGSPANPKLLTNNSGFETTAAVAGQGRDCWYYLNSDIKLTNARKGWLWNWVNVRIILNGYSLGSLTTSLTVGGAADRDTKTKLQLFDSAPVYGITTSGYNPNPTKYYRFNATTGVYSDYYTSVPSGCSEVTSMPTFQTNTYIKVTGSAISPNAQTGNRCTFALITSNGNNCQIFMTNIAIVGLTAISSTLNNADERWMASIMTAEDNGTIYLDNVTIIGNGMPPLRILSKGHLYLQNSKVYGNRSILSNNFSNYTASNLNFATPYESSAKAQTGIFITSTANTVNFYNNNVGLLNFNENTYVNMRGVSWGSSSYSLLTYSNLVSVINSNTSLSGRIEFFNTSFTLSSNRSYPSGLTLLMNGGTLTIPSGTTLNQAETANSGTVTVQGALNSAVSRTNNGAFNVQSGARLDVKSGYTAYTVNNTSGTVNVYGTISTYSDNSASIFNIKSSGSYTVASGKTLAGQIYIDGGKLTVSGTVNNLYQNTGTLTINSSGTVTLPSGKTSTGTISNAGTLNVNGTVNDIKSNTGTININANATVADITSNTGTININAKGKLTVKADKSIAGTTNNSGTLNLLGAITTTLSNKANAIVNLSGSVENINNAGLINITADTARFTNIENASGTVTVQQNVTYTLPQNIQLNGILNNAGNLTVFGRLATLNNAQNAYGIIKLGANAENATNHGTLIIEGRVTNFVNAGNTTISGGVTTLRNEVAATATVTPNAFVEELNNFGTLALQGQVTTLNNSAIVTIDGKVTTLRNAAGADATINGEVETVENLSKVTIHISGIVNNMANKAGATATIQGKVESLENNGNTQIDGAVTNLYNRAGAATQLNGSAKNIENNGNITVTGEVEVLQNASGAKTILSSSSIVQQLIQSGTCEVMGIVQNLTFTAGEITVSGANAVLPGYITVPNSAKLTVLRSTTLPIVINNNGTCEIYGFVKDINNTNLVNINVAAEVTGTVNNATSGIVNNSGTVNNLENLGTCKIKQQGAVDNLLSKGKTLIEANASVNMLTVEDGYTDILDNAIVYAAALNNGTLEIRRLAMGLLKENCNFEVEGRLGTLIDHRGEPSPTEIARERLKMFLIIGGSITGSLLLLILLLVIIIAQMKKKKKFKLTQGGTNQELIPVVAKGEYADNRKAVKRGYKEFKTDLKSRVKSANKTKLK